MGNVTDKGLAPPDHPMFKEPWTVQPVVLPKSTDIEGSGAKPTSDELANTLLRNLQENSKDPEAFDKAEIEAHLAASKGLTVGEAPKAPPLNPDGSLKK